jgi:hypothetical protein
LDQAFLRSVNDLMTTGHAAILNEAFDARKNDMRLKMSVSMHT